MIAQSRSVDIISKAVQAREWVVESLDACMYLPHDWVHVTHFGPNSKFSPVNTFVAQQLKTRDCAR